MIKMGQKIEILREYFIEGTPKKEISRKMNISRNTVKSYIQEFEESKAALIDAGVSKYELIENMIEAPKYDTSSRKPTVLTDEIKIILIGYIKENEVKRQTGNRKLMMTAQDMHEELLEKGYSLSYTTVAQYVQKYKESEITYEAFIKQTYEYGKVCEFDWGEAKLIISGEEIRLKMAVFTMAKSLYRFAYLYPYENTQCFIDAHIRFFEAIGGIPETMVYDNMKVAVARFVGRTEREATVALKKISIYYGFKYRFCNLGRGNEKGHVENSVDFIRRKAFSLSNIFKDMELAQTRLELRLDKHNRIKTKYLGSKSPDDLMVDEKKHLLKLMPAYVNYEIHSARVDKLSTISYQQNRYSVPDHLVKKAVDLRVYVDKVEIYFSDSQVASHRRLSGNHLWSIDILHYRKTLLRKPGALNGSMAFNQMQFELKNIFNRFFKDNQKSFIELLDIVSDYGIVPVLNTITKLEKGNAFVTTDNIKLIIQRKDDFNVQISEGRTKMQKEIENFSKRQLLEYDSLIGTENISEGSVL